MPKWVTQGGLYSFKIEERGEFFDLDVTYLGNTEFYWFRSLGGAKSFVLREYAGLDVERWKKVKEGQE